MKAYPGFIILLWTLISGPFALAQTCEIKHGIEERNSLQFYSPSIGNEINDVTCYQIGNEFNSAGKSLEGKPIFACCRNAPL